jgi:hypothetical protein
MAVIVHFIAWRRAAAPHCVLERWRGADVARLLDDEAGFQVRSAEHRRVFLCPEQLDVAGLVVTPMWRPGEATCRSSALAALAGGIALGDDATLFAVNKIDDKANFAGSRST